MMLTPLIRRQLKIFTVLAVGSLVMIALLYARLPAAVGIGVYEVSAEFQDASGLYPKANVTYRGVKVGQVTEMSLSGDGSGDLSGDGPGDRSGGTATATLRLDSDTRIPADVEAELHTTSAVGEQYIDLVPQDADGPWLQDGAVLTPEQTTDMPQISPVLDELNELLVSVPATETRAVLDQLDAGLHDADGDIGGLVDASSQLLQSAQSRIDATTGLIGALEPVLATQQDLSGETVAYARDLAAFTDEVAAHDADLRSLLETGPEAVASASALVADLQGPLPLLLANVTTNAQVFNTYLPNLEQTLVVYPATVARVQSTVNPRAQYGDVQLDLKATFNDPPHCIAGYLPAAQRRSPSDQSLREVDGTAHCRAAPAGPAAVRGARNLPCVSSGARGALPAACGLQFRGGIRKGASGSVPYDAISGRFVGPDGRTYQLDTPTPTRGEDAWKSLVLGPLGLS